jgi:hypothetical protein
VAILPPSVGGAAEQRRLGRRHCRTPRPGGGPERRPAGAKPGLLYPSDLRHLGAFRLPVGASPGQTWAIIEGMFAGVPCLVREGFNYGYHYPYINPQTGCFAAENQLPDKLLWMTENYRQFTPREWVAANMTCQRATEILSSVIARTAAARGEPWTGGLAVKVNKLHNMDYWEPEDARRFEPDYQFLRSAIRA